MAKSRLVGCALKRLRAPVTDLQRQANTSALCGIPLAGSPGETRVDSFDGFASAKRAGRSSLGGRPGSPHPSRGTPVRKDSDRDPASAGNRSHSVNPTRVALPRAASATRKVRTAGPTKPG